MHSVFRMGSVLRTAVFLSIAIVPSSLDAKPLILATPDSPDEATTQFIETLINDLDSSAADLEIETSARTTSKSRLEGILEGKFDGALVTLPSLIDLLATKEHALDLASLLSQPLQFSPPQELFDVQSSPYGQAALTEINDQGVIAISFWNRGFSKILSNKSIKTAEDLKGKKMRLPELQAGDQVLRNFGAAGTNLPLAEVYQGLTRGAIDAAEVGPERSENFVFSLGGIASVTGGYRPLTGVFVLSEPYWTGLTERQKASLARSGTMATSAANATIQAEEQDFRLAANEQEITYQSFHQIDQQTFLHASNEAWLEQKGPNDVSSTSLLAAYRERTARRRNNEFVNQRLRPVSANGNHHVWFATDREELSEEDLEFRFGKAVNPAVVTCGKILYAPDNRRRVGHDLKGPLGIVQGTGGRGKDPCVGSIAQSIAEEGGGRVLIFVHGFNNSFDAAIRRSIEFVSDIEYSGVALLWSWPAEGRTLAYSTDEETIDWTWSNFRTFAKALLRREGVDRVDFLAHSMGNRLLLRLLENLSEESYHWPIKSVVMAAPDVSLKNFEQKLGLAHNVGLVRSLYAAEYDRPLQISALRHDAQRAGQGGSDKIVVLPNLDSLDATEVEAGYLLSLLTMSHAHVFTVPEAIADVKQMLNDNPIENRRLREEIRLDGPFSGSYWIIEPTF